MLEPVKVEPTYKKIEYLSDVKSILDKRCVSCHSCYNSPCQAKFSSFDGVDRGGSKQVVYDALRLTQADPTRLFIDAQTTDEWRKKEFFSLTQKFDANTSYNDSIMMHMLHEKKIHPEIIGSYDPERDDLVCPRDKEEMSEYVADKPNHGMPYGFPSLKEGEYQTLAQWLQQGAKGPTKQQQIQLESPSITAAQEIEKWEAFFNATDAKHAMTARYLYEHLFLAHIHFKAAPMEFYEIVRSKTPAPQPIDLIPSLRPFDDPGVKKFYYRFRRIYSTIVHKTHMVVAFDDAKLKRFNELFIEPKWVEEPHHMSYETRMSSNPFIAFFQIPAKSRYQFLLDHSHYIVMTFIRGPVCRGQMALNVIHDHFWVMFQDPDHDITLEQQGFLLLQANNLRMPIESATQSLLETFSDKYRDRYERYFDAKEKLYDKMYPDGQGIEGIWKGNTPEDAPLLTVYRHFDSASVHRGVLGELPKTAWVIDYPQFERIYYTLVAGYDVFGNISHQTNIRRYMDFLRIEGELNFLSYLPESERLRIFKQWYIGDDDIQKREKLHYLVRPTQVAFKSQHYKQEFIEQVVEGHILKSTGIAFDDMNYIRADEQPPQMPKEFHTLADIHQGARSLTIPGSGFISYVTDNEINVILVRIMMDDGSNYVRSIVINRWHDNVNSLFNGEQHDSKKDTMDVIKGSVGSYPNLFAVVKYDDLPDFFDALNHFDGSSKYKEKLKKYFISRSDEKFWDTFDWFQNHFNEANPVQAGLYDLNRYYRKGWSH
jgi:hypothetical protein